MSTPKDPARALLTGKKEDIPVLAERLAKCELAVFPNAGFEARERMYSLLLNRIHDGEVTEVDFEYVVEILDRLTPA